MSFLEENCSGCAELKELLVERDFRIAKLHKLVDDQSALLDITVAALERSTGQLDEYSTMTRGMIDTAKKLTL